MLVNFKQLLLYNTFGAWIHQYIVTRRGHIHPICPHAQIVKAINWIVKWIGKYCFRITSPDQKLLKMLTKQSFLPLKTKIKQMKQTKLWKQFLKIGYFEWYYSTNRLLFHYSWSPSLYCTKVHKPKGKKVVYFTSKIYFLNTLCGKKIQV